jgi:hypothetical protein
VFPCQDDGSSGRKPGNELCQLCCSVVSKMMWKLIVTYRSTIIKHWLSLL